MHRIERKQTLQPLQDIWEQETEEAESDQGHRIAHPGLLDIFLDTAKPVDRPLQRSKHRMEKRPLPFEDVVHKNSGRLRDSHYQREEDQNLRDTQ
jgi:hypothetical protein